MAAGPVQPPRTHDEDLASRAQGAAQEIRRRQQLARFFVSFLIVGVWLVQTAFVTYHAVANPLILNDIEKFIGLLGCHGALVGELGPEALAG